MKINKIIVVFFIIIPLISLACVNAEDNSTFDIATSQDACLKPNLVSSEGDFDVEVSNVFNGYENTIVVNCPNATGSVDIAVGDNIYNPVFINGSATQSISDYKNGVNNVSVKYNNLTKNVSFKVLDGIVTYNTFYDYFDENDGYKFHDYIPDGVTLDFHGNITYINLNKTEDFNILSININKPVNIISSTHDAFIDFNGKAGSLLGEYQGSTFSITNGGSWSNVTGITIRNTQVWVYNAHHVVLDNISVIVEDARIGSGVGATSIRANSTWCTVKNSYFYTRNNGGSSSLVLAWADYCTFDNNTVVGEGYVGNLIYATTYNVDFPKEVIPNCHNNITNNRMYGPNNSANICWMLVISGRDTLLLNNTMVYGGGGIMNQWVDASWYGGDAVPVGNMYIGNKLYGGCGMTVSANSIAYGNMIEGKATLNSNIIFFNNTIGKSLEFQNNVSNLVIYNNYIKESSISASNVVFHDNVIGSLNVEANNISFYNNELGSTSVYGTNIQFNNSYLKSLSLGRTSWNLTLINNTIEDSLVVFSNNNTIIGNNISTKDEYAINLRKTTGNVVTGNYLLSSKHFGDNAVSFTNENIIKDNYPFVPDVLISVEIVNNFENIVTVTVPNCSGNIIIRVSDKKYDLTFDNGVATQRVSGLEPGNYTLTVDYQDDKSPIYASNSTNIMVPKIDAYNFQVPVNEYMEGNVIIPVTLPSDAHGKVIIDNCEGIVINGEANVTLDLTEGEYYIDVTFADSQRYAEKSISVHIKVAHNPNVVLTVSDITTYYINGKITAKLTDYNSKPIADATIVMNDVEVNTNSEGVADFDYRLAVGTHEVSASFKGDSQYKPASAIATVNVLSRFTGNKNIVMDYYDGSKYAVRIIGDDGKFVGANQIVKITIGSISKDVKTDKNGYATLTITNNPSKYTITATYKGQSVKNTAQIKQTLKTSKVTVKKTAKSFNLKATLKTSKNKAIKNKKITFKFNGKTYATKTNSKGIASVKIDKNVIKKLKKSKKYVFTVKYISNTIKNQVIVK